MRAAMASALIMIMAMTTGVLGEAPGNAGDRVHLEAVGVFRTIMAEDDEPQRCQFDVAWYRYPVPGWLAREELDVTLEKGVVAPSEPVPFIDALDPDRRARQAFCTLSDFNSASISAKGDAPVRRTSYTFPVFDKDFERAVVIVREDYLGSGPNRSGSFIYIAAFVMKKTGNAWKIGNMIKLVVT